MACMKMDNSSEEHQHRLAAIKNMVEFYDVLRGASHVLTDEQYNRCDQAAMRFLLHQNALSMIYLDRKYKLYNVTFKSHLFWHLAKQCRWFNCMRGWSYRDESFVGSVARVIKSIVKGGGAMKVGDNLAERWRMLQWFRLRRRQGALYV